jgi:iron(III) transport system substrate-binding protein
MQALVARFSTKYPGVTLQLLRITGPQQYQRFMQETEAGQHVADVLLSSDRPLFVDLARRGHIASSKTPAPRWRRCIARPPRRPGRCCSG